MSFEKPQQRLTARFHEIEQSTPLRQAALQMAKGWEGAKGSKASRWYWNDCPDLREPKRNAPDFRGQIWGQLVVVGLLAKPHRNSGPASWVVRCSCGTFETRTAKAITRKNNPDEGCANCTYIQYLRRLDYFNRTGKWPS